MAGGGVVLVQNEWSYYAQTDNLNAVLTSLGTSLRYESGAYYTTNDETTVPGLGLGSHPLLSGVTAIRLAASSAVLAFQ